MPSIFASCPCPLDLHLVSLGHAGWSDGISEHFECKVPVSIKDMCMKDHLIVEATCHGESSIVKGCEVPIVQALAGFEYVQVAARTKAIPAS